MTEEKAWRVVMALSVLSVLAYGYFVVSVHSHYQQFQFRFSYWRTVGGSILMIALPIFGLRHGTISSIRWSVIGAGVVSLIGVIIAMDELLHY
jgi:hypothetical protein